ncbi:MAG TPA: hypothetical protein VFL92_13250 [Sphingomonas sp.]|nr:hypothetical protein [Sphingomonas sp.]
MTFESRASFFLQNRRSHRVLRWGSARQNGRARDMKPNQAIAAALLAAGIFSASAANAKEYVDYNYGKGVWAITEVEVDPNHIDDYLTGLRASEVPAFGVMKRRGLIDDWVFLVRNGYSKGHSDVMIGVHYLSMQGLMPDAARDQALEKEIFSTFSEEQGKQAVAGYEKYRRFHDQATWLSIDFPK